MNGTRNRIYIISETPQDQDSFDNFDSESLEKASQCICMAISVSVQYNNSGFLLDIILLTLCHYHWRTPLNHVKRFSHWCLFSHQYVLTINFPPGWVDAQRGF